MNSRKYFKKYFTDFSALICKSDDIIADLEQISKIIYQAKKNFKKVLIFGNGGSAAIASHVSVDLTKNAAIRCMNFNESALITCFGNDFGYEHWVEKAVEYYGDEGDILIVISSSGSSKNMLNACKAARINKFSAIITLSGFDEMNPLRQLGDINLWVNCSSYNYIENLHQLWLLAIVDFIIDKK